MTTTELIKILQDKETGAISLKPREISLTINGRYMPNPQITLSSTGDGICGAEIDLDVCGEWLEQEPKWIPMTTRPMTEEEREYYREWSDVDEAMIFDCKLPEDGQEVLVSYGGYVCVDTFCKDDGCYFEGVDIDDVDAWMPLPAPFEPQESEGTDADSN